MIAAFEELQIESMLASEGALREGLLNDMIETASGHDIRIDTVRDFELRYQIDVAQSGRICSSAMHMYDQLDIETEDQQRLLLLWSCKLHEVGLSISHTNYPDHSGYIIEQSDMPGFSREMQNTLGLLLRLQRGKIKTQLIEEFPRLDRKILLILSLLRIAIILERSRDFDSTRLVQIKIKENLLKLNFTQGYLDKHPLTHADLTQECTEILKLGYRLKFK